MNKVTLLVTKATQRTPSYFNPTATGYLVHSPESANIQLNSLINPLLTLFTVLAVTPILNVLHRIPCVTSWTSFDIRERSLLTSSLSTSLILFLDNTTISLKSSLPVTSFTSSYIPIG